VTITSKSHPCQRPLSFLTSNCWAHGISRIRFFLKVVFFQPSLLQDPRPPSTVRYGRLLFFGSFLAPVACNSLVVIVSFPHPALSFPTNLTFLSKSRVTPLLFPHPPGQCGLEVPCRWNPSLRAVSPLIKKVAPFQRGTPHCSIPLSWLLPHTIPPGQSHFQFGICVVQFNNVGGGPWLCPPFFLT